jgi:hypothetical protein
MLRIVLTGSLDPEGELLKAKLVREIRGISITAS